MESILKPRTEYGGSRVGCVLVEVFPEGDTMEAMVKRAMERLMDLEEEESGLRNELHC